jgi:hypothetical protein
LLFRKKNLNWKFTFSFCSDKIVGGTLKTSLNSSAPAIKKKDEKKGDAEDKIEKSKEKPSKTSLLPVFFFAYNNFR